MLPSITYILFGLLGINRDIVFIKIFIKKFTEFVSYIKINN